MNQSSPNAIYSPDDHSAGTRHAVPVCATNVAPAPLGEQNDSPHAVPASDPLHPPDSHSGPDPATSLTRCPHLYPSGRHCRKPVFDQHFGLCGKHFAASQKDRDVADLTPELVGGSNDLNTLEGLYDFLANLLILLAQNRVSARRASVLAFITSQLTGIDSAIERAPANAPSQIILDNPRPIRD